MNYKKILILILLLLPVAVLAQGLQYQPLVGVPGVSADSGINLDTYINALYALSITIAALLAVIKIIIAGVKWMLSDVVTSKQEAKSDIWGATLGLLIVISAVLIFTQINPQITETSLFITETGTTFSSNTKSQMPRPTAPAGSVFTLMENNSTNESICVNQYGGAWHTDDSSELVWCVVAPREVVRRDEVGCLQDSGSATGYNCENTANDCQNMGAISPYSQIIYTESGQEIIYRRKCIYQ